MSLSHEISKYYLSNRVIPQEILNIYNMIQPDIISINLNSKKLRSTEVASGLMSIPYVFF